ncbi:MAG: TRAP transporter small permease [Planctomycetales bacterium]|nr:TRAP transporter small permease [Planctomycetales bacterium]
MPTKPLERVLALYYCLLKHVLGALLAGMTIPICLQMASRSCYWIPSFTWTEEAARFCFVWIVMIGSIIAVRDGTHFVVDLFSVPNNLRHLGISRLVIHSLMSIFSMVFVIFGIHFVEFGWHQYSEMSGLSLVWVYSAFPVAGVSWLLFLSEKISDDIGLLAGETPLELVAQIDGANVRDSAAEVDEISHPQRSGLVSGAVFGKVSSASGQITSSTNAGRTDSNHHPVQAKQSSDEVIGQ